MQDPSSAIPAAKTFLRRGSGWETRVAATREGRRYVPRGGPVKDYSQEEVPALARRRRAAAASRISHSPSKLPTGRAAPAGGSGGTRRASGAGRAAALPPTDRQSPACVQQLAAPPHAPAAAQLKQPAVSKMAAANDAWTHKLLQGGRRRVLLPSTQAAAHAALHAPGAQRQADEALKEFEALEGQVLREVGNSSVPCSASPAGRKKAGGTVAASTEAADDWAPAVGGTGPPTFAVEGTNYGEDQEEDVFQSDDEGRVHSIFAESSQAQAAASGIAHPLARRAMNFAGVEQLPALACVAEDEEEMAAESSFVRDLPPQAASNSGQRFFGMPQPAASAAMGAGSATAGAQRSTHQFQQRQAWQLQGVPSGHGEEAEAVEQLQQEVVRLQEERARVARLRLELEEAAAWLDQERAVFEKRKGEEATRFEAERAEELRKLQRDRRVLEKQSRAIFKMPTKQSKEEVAAVEALLAEERRTGRARDARHKLTVERLRQQIVELQDKNGELREQVQCLERQLLQHSWGVAADGSTATGAAAATPAGTEAAAAPAAGGSTQASSAAPAGVHPAVGSGAAVPAASRQEKLRGSAHAAGVGWGVRSAPAAVRTADATPAGISARCGHQEAHAAGQQEQQAAWLGSEDVDEQVALDVELSAEGVPVYEELGEQQNGDTSTTWGASRGSRGGGAAAWHAATGTQAGSQSLSAAGSSCRQVAHVVGHQPAVDNREAALDLAAAPQPAPAVGEAMSKASCALARFNQLRKSLTHHEALGSLSRRAVSLQSSPTVAGLAAGTPMPAAVSAAGFPAAAPPGGSEDDLRRLGRSLLAAAGQPPPAEAPQAQQAPGTAPAVLGSAGDAVVSHVQHLDGRAEQLYASGLRETRFANGSTRRTLPNGATLTRFANGDVKKVLACGAVEYWYAEVASWQVTHPSGVDVFFFPSGQVEAHHPGGIKEILFPDGAVRKVLPDGRELAISASHLSREIQQAAPVMEL